MLVAAPLLLLVGRQAVITAVEQTGYNRYQVTSTGTGAVSFFDNENVAIPTTSTGSEYTVTNPAQFNSVYSASQAGVESAFVITTWVGLYQASTACCRIGISSSTAADSPYQLYTPRMTVNNAKTRLTVTADRIAPQMTFVRISSSSSSLSGLLLSADFAPASTAALSRTVVLPALTAEEWETTTLQACGLISDDDESCTDYPHSAPSPPAPPSTPPIPPVPPPSPPNPPYPPGMFLPPYPPPPPPMSPTSDTNLTVLIIVVAVAVAVLVLLIAIVAVLLVRRKKGAAKQPDTFSTMANIEVASHAAPPPQA